MSEYGQICGQCEHFQPGSVEEQKEVSAWKKSRINASHYMLSESQLEDGGVLNSEMAEGVKAALNVLHLDTRQGYRGCESTFSTASNDVASCIHPDKFRRKF